mgnify:CR=1 FL=1
MEVYIIFNVLVLVISRFDNKTTKIVRHITDSFFIILIAIVFGFRAQVGADWFEYLRLYDLYTYDSDLFNQIEFGFKGINVLSHYLDLGYQGVIFISTFLFVLFTFIGCRLLYINPYLFLGVIFPYYFVMSGMNYIRQSLGLSVFIIYLSFVINGNKLKGWLSLFFGMSFHKSFLIFSALNMLNDKLRYIFVFSMPISILGLIFIFSSYSDLYLSSSHYESKGFFLRYFYVSISTLFIFLYKKPFIYKFNSLVYISFAGCFILPILSIFSTTASDRLSYYFIVLNTVLILSLKNSITKTKYVNICILGCFLSSQLAFFIWVTWGTIFNFYNFNHLLFG